MPGLIGKKIGMTSIFSPEGKNLPCTVLEVGPCIVTQVKSEDVDGYNAIQLGWGEAKDKNTSKALKGTYLKQVPLLRENLLNSRTSKVSSH